MATITFGANITDARGSVSGTVFSRNAAGAYTRGRVAPINRRTTLQTQVRANFGANSKAWSGTLTADQRAAWVIFAQANPVPNRVGASIQLSGLAMYNRLNQVLLQIGAAPITDAPSDLSVPPIADSTGAEAESGPPEIAVTTDAQIVSPGVKYYIFATGALAAGRTPPTSAFRFMGAYSAVALAVIVDITTQWVAAFGTTVTGSVVGISVAKVNITTGALSPAIRYTAISG